MFNSPYNPQITRDRIDNQIAQLQQMKDQLPSIQQPTNLTQNFQLTPNAVNGIKYVNNIDEVNKEVVMSDTPFFSRDMSVVWIKNMNNEIKAYSLEEIVQKDEKDLMIESLQMQINEMKGIINNAKSINENVNEPIKDKKSSNGKSSATDDKK